MPTVAASPRIFELALPDLALARGGVVRSHRARGWWWSREGDTPDSLRPDVPTVLLIHALTGRAQAGGPGGWWEPLIGSGRALDPDHYRIVCFNNLGSCYGSSGPGVEGFPTDPKLVAKDIFDKSATRRIRMASTSSAVERCSVGGSAPAALVSRLADHVATTCKLPSRNACLDWLRWILPLDVFSTVRGSPP